MQFPVSKHCACFQYGVRFMDCWWNDGLVWTCLLQLYRRQLAVSSHSHKIVLLSALGQLVSERYNNSFSSVNPSLWGLYCTQSDQEIIKVREWIPHIGPLTKVIRLKLFLDTVPSSSEDITRAMRGQPKQLTRITWEKWRERHFICFGFVSYRRCFLHS